MFCCYCHSDVQQNFPTFLMKTVFFDEHLSILPSPPPRFPPLQCPVLSLTSADSPYRWGNEMLVFLCWLVSFWERSPCSPLLFQTTRSISFAKVEYIIFVVHSSFEKVKLISHFSYCWYCTVDTDMQIPLQLMEERTLDAMLLCQLLPLGWDMAS